MIKLQILDKDYTSNLGLKMQRPTREQYEELIQDVEKLLTKCI